MPQAPATPERSEVPEDHSHLFAPTSAADLLKGKLSPAVKKRFAQLRKIIMDTPQ